MSSVDAPPGLEIGGLGRFEFVAPASKRRLAHRVFWFVLITGAITALIAARHPHREGAHLFFSAPLFLLSIAIMGLAVRSARVTVEPEALRWGWRGIAFRAKLASLKWVRIYDDAIAMRSKRGSVWYLGSTDLADFDRLAEALEESELPVERAARRAPLWARLQSYGGFLDGILLITVLLAGLALFGVLTR